MNSTIKYNQRKVTKLRVRKDSRRKLRITNESDSKENTLKNPSDDDSVRAQLCRVCLNEGEIPIYGDESIGDISESLGMYGGVEIHLDDEFPKHLCHDCHGQLQSAIKFRQTAQETDQFLKDNFLTVKETMIIDFKENSDIEEETIFKETLADINTVYHCRACEIDFLTPQEYGRHMFSENHRNLKDVCPFCCRENSCIQRHLEMHKVSKTVLCKVCGEKFLRPNFWRHRESHYNILPFKCPKCPYQSRYGGDFKVHMRKHTGERPYQCSNCSAGFINKSNLNRHMLTHKNDYNFQCSECAKGYFNRQKLDMHIKVSHIGVKEHLCNLCGKAYGSRKSLMKHQLQVHKREKLRGGKIPIYLQLQSKDRDDIDTENFDEEFNFDEYVEEL